MSPNKNTGIWILGQAWIQYSFFHQKQ